MPSLAELRKKIKGISSTRQITKAMKMVAGARFSRAARQMNDARYFEAETGKLLSDFLLIAGRPRGRFASLCSAPASANSGADARPGKAGIIVVAADKGLCGDFNNSILREADGYCKKNGDRVVVLVAVGRKAAEHYKNSSISRKIIHQQFFNRFDFSTADAIGQEVVKLSFEENLSEYTVVHSHFKSMIKQQLTVTRLLPFDATVTAAAPRDSQVRCTMTEPSEEEAMLRALLPMYIKAKLYGILRDSFTAELAARMRAMDNATRNAGSLIDSITLEMNKVRQSVITREIAEIIATNEVVK
jgi:F-type H+-transporting ATPase subunit gamma